MEITPDGKKIKISQTDVLRTKALVIEVSPDLPIKFVVNRLGNGQVHILMEAD